MSYGPDQAEVFRQIGMYAGRILKGAKPADMPVMQSAKFEFIINLRTAKAQPRGYLSLLDPCANRAEETACQVVHSRCISQYPQPGYDYNDHHHG